MKKFGQMLFKTACFYTFSSLAYVLAISLSVDGKVALSDAYTLIFKNLLVLLGFSAAFGVSFLLFDIKKLPSTAKRLLHALFLYVCAVGACLLMANVGDDIRKKVLFIFVATFIYVVIYCICAVVSFFVKRKKSN